jgi:hypothetical protein
MAVIQISQIQVRRGFLEELGQLGSGEFGWAIDKLRLFIGNGTITEGAPYEGNTELLTSNSDIRAILGVYTYEGALGGYVVQTGVDIANKVTRAFQDKIDDIINIRDFGAKGNGFDDDTDAIQRAINEIYGRRALIPPPQTRRTINFHPGVYLISRALTFPPYTCLRNSGRDSVIIKLVGTSGTGVFKVSDGSGLYYNSEPLQSSSLSFIGPVECTGIRFESTLVNVPVGDIDSTKGAYFNRCQFVGPTVATTANTSVGVSISSEVSSTRNVHFIECDFNQFGKVVDISAKEGIVSDIVIDRCTISNSFKGIVAEAGNVSIQSIRVTNSVFASIAEEALVTDANVSRVTSAFNTYTEVGKSYSPSMPAGTHVIDFGGNLCYSIADMIDRSAEDEVYFESVKHRTGTSVSTHSGNHFRFGNTYQTIGRSVILPNATTNYIPISTRYKSGIIDYTIERGGFYRTGTVKFSFSTAFQTFDFHDSFTETHSTGVDLTVEYNSSLTGILKPYIICILANLATDAVFTYDIKTLYQ